LACGCYRYCPILLAVSLTSRGAQETPIFVKLRDIFYADLKRAALER
jgi:hypothetical protein